MYIVLDGIFARESERGKTEVSAAEEVGERVYATCQSQGHGSAKTVHRRVFFASAVLMHPSPHVFGASGRFGWALDVGSDGDFPDRRQQRLQRL
jgi:hypothetical protein